MTTRRLHWLALGALTGVCVLAGTAAAQNLSITDPYDPWNAGYRQFIYPTAPINPALPNQLRYDVITGRNPFQPYGDFPLDDLFERNTRPSGRFVPYYRSSRASDGALDRSYVPNRNDTFYADQQERQKRYFEALREKNPQKRAEMLKKLEEESRQATREASAGRQKGGERAKSARADNRPSSATGRAATRGAAAPAPTRTRPAARSGTRPLVDRDAPAPDEAPEPQPSDVLDRAHRLLDRPTSLRDRPGPADPLLRRPGERRPGLDLAPRLMSIPPLPGAEASDAAEAPVPAPSPPPPPIRSR